MAKATPLKLARITEGVSQDDLAKLCGMTRRALSLLEAGGLVRDRTAAMRLYVYFLHRGHKLQLIDIYDPEHLLGRAETLTVPALKPVGGVGEDMAESRG